MNADTAAGQATLVCSAVELAVPVQEDGMMWDDAERWDDDALWEE